MSIMTCDMCGEMEDSDYVEFIEMESDWEGDIATTYKNIYSHVILSKGDVICRTCSESLPEGAGE